MLDQTLTPSAIAVLHRLVVHGTAPEILEAQLLGAAGLMTQQLPGPIRATDLGREALESLSKV